MNRQPLHPLDKEQLKILEKIAASIRQLSIDAIEKANSGHPGMPLGCAELAAYFYGRLLRHNPKDPSWLNRDRFILSAGHGSMLLYSSLHLAGFDLSIEDLKAFRQLHSKTPGHPEKGPGVETTTGPLGQGFAHAVGQALSLKILSKRFTKEEEALFDARVYVLAGDGDFMEGVVAEASSFAGHLKLNNLVVFYDYNEVTLDGALSDACSDDVAARYRSYGWEVYEIDGHHFEQIDHVCQKLFLDQEKPALILAKTIIGKGSPNRAGSHKVHGAPLGTEEAGLTKQALGLQEEPFFVPQTLYKFFEKKCEGQVQEQKAWEQSFQEWKDAKPELFKDFERMREQSLPNDLEEKLQKLQMPSSFAGREACGEVLQFLGRKLPYLYGGSADLSCSDKSLMKDLGFVSAPCFKGRNIKFGVREFAMASICIGMNQSNLMRSYCATFFAFSDYMRPAIRMAALLKERVIFQFTHDSIFIGSDGPTHQPVEQLASLRAMPNVLLLRPADNHEVKMAWLAALRQPGPSVICVSRQKLPQLEETNVCFEEGLGRGAYIVKKEAKTADYSLFSSGSELSLSLDLARELEKMGKAVRVVSMPSWELFEAQDESYRQKILGGDIGKRVSIEAGVELGWHKYIGSDGIAISLESFGASASEKVLASEYGYLVESILERIL